MSRPGIAAHWTVRSVGTVMHGRAWASEFVETAILIFAEVLLVWLLFGSDSPVARGLPGLPVRLACVGLATGLLLALLIVSPLGRISGGHMNPAVTVAFWLLRAIPGRDAAGYVAAQLLGSVAGVLLGHAVLGYAIESHAVNYAAIRPAPGWSAGGVFAGETVSLAVLMTVVVLFLARPALARWTPVAVGVAVAVLITVGGLGSGGSFNPARQFGPGLFAHEWQYLWVYLTAPLAGSVAFAVLARALRSPSPLTCDLCGDTVVVDTTPGNSATGHRKYTESRDATGRSTTAP
jgi:glycerol uptake facilitator-like aquaporin